jgi:hypothetical protein
MKLGTTGSRFSAASFLSVFSPDLLARFSSGDFHQ